MELDRFTKGFIGGALAGITMVIPNYLLYVLDINRLRYLDWAAVLIYGSKPNTIGETVFAEMGHIFFAGLLGIIFVFLIPKLFSSSNFYTKSLIYSIFVWFGVYTLAIMFKLPFLTPFLTKVTLGSAVSNLFGAITYGLVIAWILSTFFEKEGIEG